MNFMKKKNFLEEAIQSRLDKYNKDNISEDNKSIKTNKSSYTTSTHTRNKGDKNDKKTDTIDTKFTIDKETMLLPYFINNEKNEKKNEDSTKDCLTINKLLIHPFYSEIDLTESFLKFLFKTETVNKEKDGNQ